MKNRLKSRRTRFAKGEFTLGRSGRDDATHPRKMGPMSQMVDMLPGDMGKAAR